jgi:hypothetical protein
VSAIDDPNKEPEPFTPETLEGFEKCAEGLRLDFLCDVDEAGADPVATQHALVALAHLELAQRAFALARLAQTSALGRRPH